MQRDLVFRDADRHRLDHRGAAGAEKNTGDGAGIITQVPDALLRATVSFELPAAGEYAVGTAFLPQDEAARAAPFLDDGTVRGVLAEGRDGGVVVDNDATLVRYASMAVAQARAGAHRPVSRSARATARCRGEAGISGEARG